MINIMTSIRAKNLPVTIRELFQLIDLSFQKNTWRYEGRVRSLTEEAGDNVENLVQTWRALQPARRIGFKFLLENMPESDLRSLSKDFLLEHIDGAYEAWKPRRGENRYQRRSFSTVSCPMRT